MKIWTLICTDILARGIDFKGINLVINYDLPTSVIQYIHRAGRTGRLNRMGKCISFFTKTDRKLLRMIGNVLKISVWYRLLTLKFLGLSGSRMDSKP